ncbi:unnamed protein product [Chrysodeixis includens]|uniref:Secreted protein n=1 Tax=Chrysodeixis includens TaxID=689277 RepID=A0A9N8PYV6_CHRIL|nr:unnamed protein product [Chrysodeixis includens]
MCRLTVYSAFMLSAAVYSGTASGMFFSGSDATAVWRRRGPSGGRRPAWRAAGDVTTVASVASIVSVAPVNLANLVHRLNLSVSLSPIFYVYLEYNVEITVSDSLS